jgi:hypothetical protein
MGHTGGNPHEVDCRPSDIQGPVDADVTLAQYRALIVLSAQGPQSVQKGIRIVN